ncbi:PBP2_BugE_Glu domain containing protein [Burkholderiaceae bacterium]|jgi:tripartite-type tricarboxylate transporter receptor subunit TctC
MKIFHKVSFVFMALVFGNFSALAQTAYPDQPVKLVVPFGPGGSTDLSARLIAEYAGRELGQQIIVENRAGAGGSVGMEYVAKAKPDGYTLGMATMSTHGANSAVYAGKLKYDPIKDFSPITNVATTPSVFAVNPKVTANNMQQFIALAQANPNKFSYATPGTGSLGHANVEYFSMLAKIRLLHVPYKGAGAAMNDALAGQVDAITDNLPSALPHIKAGRLRALVVLSEKRSPALPDVPTYAEVGFPQMGGGGWFGIVAPAGTPPSVVAKLNKAILQGMKNPEFIKKLEESGAVAIPGTPAEFAMQIQQAVDRYQRVAKVTNIQID